MERTHLEIAFLQLTEKFPSVDILVVHHCGNKSKLLIIGLSQFNLIYYRIRPLQYMFKLKPSTSVCVF
jgi:hypothetical protein